MGRFEDTEGEKWDRAKREKGDRAFVAEPPGYCPRWDKISK